LAGLCALTVLTSAADGRRAQTDKCPESSPAYDGPCGPLFTTPQWADQTSWSSPSAYETIALARLGGASQESLIGRDSTGLWVARFDAKAGQWRLLGSAEGGVALALPDQQGWNRPSQYTTIQTADLDGDGEPELLARAADGLHVYRWASGTATFTDVSKAPRLFSDAAGATQASVYETIQTADLSGTGRADLLVRTPSGIEYASWNEGTGHFEGVTQTGIAPDAHGGNHPSLYQTIQSGDVSGDGRADLLLLANGLRRYVRDANGRYPEESVLSALDHQHGFGRASQYQTVHAVRIGGKGQAVVLARAADGLHVYRREDGEWSPAAPVLDGLSDAHGFEKPSQYRTIRAGDVTGHGRLDVVARTATGIAVWELKDGAWRRLSSGPALTGSVWEDHASHFDTIRLGDITGHGNAALVARGVFGIRTFTWHDGAYRRPHPYGHFAAFEGSEAAAYAEVARLLLGREGSFRTLTYASPHEAITEATLNDYRARLAERCVPLAAKRRVGGPPQYTDCTPPAGSGVETAAWTAVSNQLIAELWAASGVVAHFSILDTLETKLFQDQQSSLPALDAELALPPNPPDRTPNYLKLFKGSLDILSTLVQFFPPAALIPNVLRTVALTGHALGATADALGLSGSGSPPSPYGSIVTKVAKLQQEQRDITQAQRRYVLADPGLLSAVGAEVKGRLLTLDESAALSAGRQAFAIWVTQMYLPLYWRRYHVTGCRNGTDAWPPPATTYKCDVPSGSFARVTGHNGASTNFHAVLVGGSGCSSTDFYELVLRACTWRSPAGATYDRVVSPVPKECRYDPTPGSTAAWRYGCPYDASPAELLDATHGWELPLTRCTANAGSCSQARVARSQQRRSRRVPRVKAPPPARSAQ
jgi:hypothetical protein